VRRRTWSRRVAGSGPCGHLAGADGDLATSHETCQPAEDVLCCAPVGRCCRSPSGETISEAAQRETQEETGVPVTLEGIVRVENAPGLGGTARYRVVIVARPADDTPARADQTRRRWSRPG